MLKKEDYQEPECPLSPPSGTKYHDPAERIPLSEIIAGCDRLFNEEKSAELGDFLRKWREKAVVLGDKKGELSLLNELMGHYRMSGDKERGMKAVKDAFRLLAETGISGTVSAGTILLNGATALKSFGEVKEALRHYAEAFRCYGNHLAPEDPLWAGLFNNMASAYMDNGEYNYAEAYYKKALALLKQNGNLMDQAVTQINLAQLYCRMTPEHPEIPLCLDRAFACFEDPKAEYNGYYAHTCRKCAGAFADFGQKGRAEELNGRADALYARD